MSNNITHNADEQRYEIHVEGILAGFSLAEEMDDQVVFTHTEVLDQFEGQGLAGELITGALDDVRVKDKKVVSRCDYVTRFIEKHPDYADLLG